MSSHSHTSSHSFFPPLPCMGLLVGTAVEPCVAASLSLPDAQADSQPRVASPDSSAADGQATSFKIFTDANPRKQQCDFHQWRLGQQPCSWAKTGKSLCSTSPYSSYTQRADVMSGRGCLHAHVAARSSYTCWSLELLGSGRQRQTSSRSSMSAGKCQEASCTESEQRQLHGLTTACKL